MRIIQFIGGALFGALGALAEYWLQSLEVWWTMVWISALVMGLFAVVFGKKFWDAAIGMWPS